MCDNYQNRNVKHHFLFFFTLISRKFRNFYQWLQFELHSVARLAIMEIMFIKC